MSTRPAFVPLEPADFAAAFPNSCKVFVEEHGVRVPMREIALTNGESLRVYDSSGPQGVDVRAGLPRLREAWVAPRRTSGMITQLEHARKGIVTEEMAFVALREGFDRSSSAPRSRAAAPSSRQTSITPSSSR